MNKFCEGCFYKYKGGLNRLIFIKDVMYKCIDSSNFTATLQLIKTINGKEECFVATVHQENISCFTKSGVQEVNWVSKNDKKFEKLDDNVKKIINTNSPLTPHMDIKKPYIAYPNNILEDKTITSNNLMNSKSDSKLDNFDTPSYYNQGKISPVEYINSNNLGFEEGNVIKYITRHKYKNGKEDIIKAMKYCEFILKYQYND